MADLYLATLASLRALLREATPIEDTNHSQACGCVECAKVWRHASGIGPASAQVVALVPGLIDAAERVLLLDEIRSATGDPGCSVIMRGPSLWSVYRSRWLHRPIVASGPTEIAALRAAIAMVTK